MQVGTFLILIIGCLLYSCAKASPIEDPVNWDKKKSMLLHQIADQYNPPSLKIGDAEKYYWPKVIARFELYGTNDSIANSWLEALKERSPFHFTLVGMARIMSLYPNAKFIKENKILLLKRVFERDDSYNAWTAEGTENHINMSRTSGYLFAQHAMEFPDEFPEAKEKLAMMKEWLQSWSKQIYQTGTGEWNSSIYEVYNMVGWLNLFDFARDPQVKAIARAVLEAYSVEMALHNSWGITGGSEMRGTGVNLDGSSATSYYYWLWFSEDIHPVNDYHGSGYIQAIHALTSLYRPHPAIMDFSRQKYTPGGSYCGSKPSYNFETASFVKQTLFIDSLYTLGNCLNNYGGFTGASYQMVPWKLVIKDSLPQIISGNGTFYNERSGKTRNPFTQTVQYNNVLIQLTRVPSNVKRMMENIDSVGEWWSSQSKKDLSLRFPEEIHKIKKNYVNLPDNRNFKNGSYLNLPITADWSCTEGMYHFKYNGVQIQVLSLNPKRDTVYYSRNRMIIETSEEYDSICGFILEVNNASDTLSQSSFLKTKDDQVEYITGKDEVIRVQYGSSGSYIEPMVDWGYGPVVPQLYSTSPPFSQPVWEKGEGYGRIARMWVDGIEENHAACNPVYSGPGIHWENGRIKIWSNEEVCEIKYDGDLPVFLN